MPIFLEISRHSPENCPGFNDTTRKATVELGDKLEELSKKHGIKTVGVWIVPGEHLVFMVFDAPSLEAFENFNDEPEIDALAGFNTSETKLAYSMQEVMQRLQQPK